MDRFSSEDGGRREEKMISRRRTNSSLPDDILYEILLRLPAKTLFQFKRASKSWYSLISSPKFISAHYAFHKKDKLSLFRYSYCSSSVSFLFSDISLVLNAHIYHGHPKIVGCCRGLVCLSLAERHPRFLLWNPATGEFRLVFMDLSRCVLRSRASVYSGFYFDDRVAANNHIILRLSVCRREEKIRVYLDVFRVGNKSWEPEKEVIIPFKIPKSDTDITQETCIGRFMYWVMEFSDENNCLLLCFDMVDELFLRTESPPQPTDHRHTRAALAEYKESLAMFIWNAPLFASSPVPSFDMWVLKLSDCNGSGGRGHTWSKKLTLKPSLYGVRNPVGFYVKGDIELVALATSGGKDLLLWNADSGEVTNVPLCEGGGGLIGQLFLYSQSLASVG